MMGLMIQADGNGLGLWRQVAAGEVRGLVGESGAGKSMIGKAVLGILPPSVEVTGGEPLSHPECDELLRALADTGRKVLLETSGAIPIDTVDPRVTIILDMKMPFSRPRRFEIEETQEFAQVCRTLRLTIEAAHGHGEASARPEHGKANSAAGSVIE